MTRAELRWEWIALDEAIDVSSRRIALIENHLRFAGAVVDPVALEAARDDMLARMDRLMTRLRAVEGQLFLTGTEPPAASGRRAAVPVRL